MGVKVDPAADAVAVDGAPVALPEENATFLLHKPAGYVTTMSDPQGRPTVAALMADELLAHPGLFPVGRLDTDTTGLLLFTDDGQLGHGLLHPRRHVEKTYLALVEGVPDAGDVRRLREGVLLDDGPTLPAGVRVLEGADGLPGRAAHRRGGRCQRLPPAPRGQARPRRAGRQGILRGSAPARGPQPPSAPHAGRRGASGDRAASRGLRPPCPGGSAPGRLPSARGSRKWRASRSSRPSSGAGEGLVWPMFRRLRVSEPIRVPARSATRADAGPLSGRGSQPAPL